MTARHRSAAIRALLAAVTCGYVWQLLAIGAIVVAAIRM